MHHLWGNLLNGAMLQALLGIFFLNRENSCFKTKDFCHNPEFFSKTGDAGRKKIKPYVE